MGWTEDRIAELRSVVARLQGLDFWPPWDAAQTIADLVAQGYRVATQPPEPDPADLRDAADEWRLVASRSRRGHDALTAARTASGPEVWEGEAGDAFRASLLVFEGRVDTVPTAADGVANALLTLATEMDAARKRHADAWDGLARHLGFSWSDLLPWELVDKLRGIVGEVVEALEDLIGAYQDALSAAEVTRREIVRAMDGIDLPDHLPASTSAVDLVNSWSDHEGPLQGSVPARYDAALAAMSAAERAEVERLLAAAGGPDARAWIMAAVASGLTGTALANYAAQLAKVDPADLDPAHWREGDHWNGERNQPDDYTCGSSSLVMARMENDPAFAMWVLTGYDPTTGQTTPGTSEQRFDQAALEMHVRTNLPVDRDGGPQLPWPPQWGTQPWAVAAEMSAEGGSGVPGTDYGVQAVDPGDPGASFDAMVRASEDGHTVPFYDGDETRPGHVALVTGSDGDTVTVYEPWDGRTVTVSRDDWVAGTVDVAGWQEPWFVVVPT
jgi:uncharacterized protein YukE